VREPALSIDPRFVRRERQPGLDLLRALAIIVVVIYHTGIFGFALPYQWHRFGWVGVDLFFVLSGYLIGGQLIGRLAQDGAIDFGRFYTRRALRILPAYFAVLAIYFLLPSWREFPEIGPLWKFLISVQNINLRGGTAFSHAWSLAIEDQFYLLLPLLLVFVSRKPGTGAVIVVAVFLGGLGLRAFLAWQHSGSSGVSFGGFQRWIYYPTWTRLDPLVLGVALAAIEIHRPVWWTRLIGSARWLWILGLAAVSCGLYIGENELTIATCVWQFPLIALGMSAFLVCVVSPRLPFRQVPIPAAAFLASIAYSVYLSHKLVIHFALQFCATYHIPLKSVRALLLVDVCIFAVGTVLFFAVERPFLQLRRRVASLE
jgi:peptidoglycan/LPS O-acetylase OafA/YrhL